MRRDDARRVLGDARATDTVPEQGAVIWIAAMSPSTVENVDGVEIRVLNVELKQAGRA